MEWNPFVLPGMVAGLAAWALAALVLKTAPQRTQNRIVAAMLAVEGSMMLLLAVPAVTTDWDLLTPVYAGTLLGAGVLALLYLAFLGTLRSRLAWALRPRPVRGALLIGCLLLAALWPFLWTGNGGSSVTISALGVVLGFGLLVSAETFLRAPRGSSERTRAGGILLAFGWRDVTMGGAIALLFWSRTTTTGPPSGFAYYDQVVWPTITLVFVALLAYAILRNQLFDIDLRIKTGLRRSLVLAPFVVVFFVGGELLEEIVPFGDSQVLGIVTAGLVALALHPIQRAAVRLSDRIMPHASLDADRIRLRKEAVYRAALESAAVDGEITAREESILARLQEELGIPEALATMLRSDVHSVSGPTDGSA